MLLSVLLARSRAHAVIDGDAAMRFNELRAFALAHAADLRSQGLVPGDRVGVWASPELHTIVALVGHALAGFVSVPINPATTRPEFEYLLADAALRVVVGRPTMSVAPARVVEVSLAAPPRVEAFSEVDPSAPALVLYTSGTTGRPKGAMLSFAALAQNLDDLARAWRWTPDDRLVHVLPLFHVHGLVLGVFGTLRVGASLRLVTRFEAEAVSSCLAGDATMLFGVPTMYHRLAEYAEREPSAARALRRARLLVSGSAALPLRDHHRIARIAEQHIYERYGLTETLINTAVRVDEGPSPGRVGRQLEGVALRLVDDARVVIDAHDDVTLGEVAVRGAHLFDGYLNRPDATAAARDDEGWFYTGDLAARDATGSLRIVGRRAIDLIKTGGYKVGAGEVEAALLEHPAVREAAVRGVADDDLGERIEAWVALRDGANVAPEQLIDHAASMVAWHKRPRRVHVVEALPRNAMGKVIKTQLGTPT